MDKPFDRCFKDLTDHAPELFLTFVGFLPLAPGWRLEILRSETAPPVLLPDFVAMAIGPGGERFVIHLEFYLDYADWQPGKMSRYGGSLMTQHDCQVKSLMILIRKGPGAPIVATGFYGKPGTCVSHDFQTVKLWELKADQILENEAMRQFFALVPALEHDWEQLRRVANAVQDTGTEEELSRLLLMLSLKYNKDTIDELIGRRKMGFGEVLWEGSSLLKDLREQAIASGLQEGMKRGFESGIEKGQAEGQVAEARRLLRAVLANRFPGLDALTEIDQITDVAVLESLLIDQALKSTHRAEVERAIRQAAA